MYEVARVAAPLKNTQTGMMVDWFVCDVASEPHHKNLEHLFRIDHQACDKHLHFGIPYAFQHESTMHRS